MNELESVISAVKAMQNDFDTYGVTEELYTKQLDLYDKLITNKALRKRTEKLFRDGHHARAVEEGYKFLDNVVKKKANLQDTNLSGPKLMQQVFSASSPIIKLNEGVSTSEQDEQSTRYFYIKPS